MRVTHSIIMSLIKYYNFLVYNIRSKVQMYQIFNHIAVPLKVNLNYLEIHAEETISTLLYTRAATSYSHPNNKI